MGNMRVHVKFTFTAPYIFFSYCNLMTFPDLGSKRHTKQHELCIQTQLPNLEKKKIRDIFSSGKLLPLTLTFPKHYHLKTIGIIKQALATETTE